MKNELSTSEQNSSRTRIDRLADKADRIANSKLYELSPYIAGLALAGLVAFGVSKGISEQRNDIPNKLDHNITVVDN